MPAINPAMTVEAVRESNRALPAPTATELRDLANRLRKLAKVIFQNGGKTDSHTKLEVGRMLEPLQIQGWYSRAVAWQDLEQQRLFKAVACLLSEIFRKSAESPVARLESVANDVEALAVMIDPQPATVEPLNDVARILDRLAVLFGDSGGKMLRVVNDPNLNTEQKLWEMERIDKPLMTSIRSSVKLGHALGVSGSQIRKTDWWIGRRKRERE